MIVHSQSLHPNEVSTKEKLKVTDGGEVVILTRRQRFTSHEDS
jgi:hypothetical protein